MAHTEFLQVCWPDLSTCRVFEACWAVSSICAEAVLSRVLCMHARFTLHRARVVCTAVLWSWLCCFLALVGVIEQVSRCFEQAGGQ
jgi:hypothetical protein